MESKELRIGNIVQRPEALREPILDGGVIYYGINTIMLRDCEHYGDNWAFEPVPLAPEILEKCGFTRYNSSEFAIAVNGGQFHVFIEHAFIKWYPKDVDEEGFFMPVHIKNLHQLQNLYFALTGEELTPGI